jgi:undecaprenyl-diphosphatase
VAAESRLAAIPLQLAAIGVGAMQPRRGKHYLSDVIVGAAIGFAAERLTNAVMERIDALLWKRSEIAAEQEVAAHPS